MGMLKKHKLNSIINFGKAFIFRIFVYFFGQRLAG